MAFGFEQGDCKCFKNQSSFQPTPSVPRFSVGALMELMVVPKKKVDAALIATGRARFTKGLGLENININTQWGFIPVDERMQVIDTDGNPVQYEQHPIGTPRMPWLYRQGP